jgi:hypothetical protein
MARKVNELKQAWAGDNPTPMESLLVERITMAWLQLAYLEAREAQHYETSLRWARLQMQRQAQAERQFRAAIDALTVLRKTQKTITVEFRQPAVVQHPAPIIAGPVNGEEPATTNGHAMQPAPVNGIKPINRVNGFMNGHNRLNDVLEPATSK